MGFTVGERPKTPNRPTALLLPPLLLLLVATLVVFRGIYSVATVDGPSMEPTLYSWDYLLVTRGYEAPRRGDIVSISPLRAGDVPLVKRVIALPGDTLQLVGQRAVVNAAPEPWPVATAPLEGRSPVWTVPRGTVWVMGDNRDRSLDSRFYGFVPLSAVRGRAFLVYWPPSRMRRLDASATAN